MKHFLQEAAKHPLVAFVVKLTKRFALHNCGLTAAGLAFFLFLSVGPMLLTALAVLASVVRPEEAIGGMRHVIMHLLPQTGNPEDVANRVIDHFALGDRLHEIVLSRGPAAIVGFLILIWAAMQIFVNAAVAMNLAFNVRETRNWFAVRGLSLMLMATCGVLALLTLVFSAMPPLLARFPIWPMFVQGKPLTMLNVVFELLAVVDNTILYFLLYRFLPNVRVPMKAALIGSCAASILWEAAKRGLASWLLLPNFSVYGGLANLILIVLWMYYSMLILVLGAEVTAVAMEGDRRRPARA
jgi:membrane protein